MNFREAYALLKEGNAITRPNWAGYWRWEDGEIIMYTKDFKRIPLLKTDRPEYTFDNIASMDFILANIKTNQVMRAWLAVNPIYQEIRALPEWMEVEKRDGIHNLERLLSGVSMQAPNEESWWTYGDINGLVLHTENGIIHNVIPTNFYLFTNTNADDDEEYADDTTEFDSDETCVESEEDELREMFDRWKESGDRYEFRDSLEEEQSKLNRIQNQLGKQIYDAYLNHLGGPSLNDEFGDRIREGDFTWALTLPDPRTGVPIGAYLTYDPTCYHTPDPTNQPSINREMAARTHIPWCR